MDRTQEFDQVVEAANSQIPPAQVERDRLKPVRDEAVALLKDLNQAIAWARPRIEACAQRLHQARQHGVTHSAMDAHLKAAAILIDGGPNTFTSHIIGRIDRLTDSDVYQRVHISLPGALNGARPLAGEIRRLVALAEGQDMAELTAMLSQSVGAPRPTRVVDPPEQRERVPTVEKDFEV